MTLIRRAATCLSLSLLFAFLPSLLLAQSKADLYERLQHLFEYQYSQGQIAGAYQTAEKSFLYKERKDWNSDDFLLYAELCAFKKEDDAVVNAVSDAVRYGNSVDDVKNDSIFSPFLTASVLADLAKVEGEYKQSISKTYADALHIIDSMDQAIRSDSDLKTRVTPAVFRATDSIDFHNFLHLVAKYGLPDKRKNGIDYPYLVLLMHASVTSDTLYAQVLAFLETMHEEAYVFKSRQALIIDRHRNWVEHIDQRFGYWSASRSVPKISDLAEVDSWRLKYNLTTLADQCRMNKQQLPEGYKPISYPGNYFGD
jgi:hypothetical protein